MRRPRHPSYANVHSDAIASTISPFEVYNGTEGDDTHTGTNSDDTLNGDGGDDTLNGGDGADLIDGGEGDDILAGDAGDDVLRGGIGDDTITSTSGADTVDGGEGTDRWIGSYASATGSLTFDQRTETFSNGTTLAAIESIQLSTGSGADQFTMNGDQAFSIDAGSGIDTFTFDPTGGTRSAAPLTVTLGIGSNYLDVTLQDGGVTNLAGHFERLAITGSSGDDLFVIPSGRFDASPSALSLDGGDGQDKLTWDMSYFNVTNFIVGDDGSIHTDFASLANFESFNLTFFSAVNVVLGAGNDTISSFYGGNIDGGSGNDTITAGREASGVIHGGAGSDKISAVYGGANIFGDGGNDSISAYGKGVQIDGGSGYDRWSYTFGRRVFYDQSSERFDNGTTLISIEKVSITTAYTGRGSGINLSKLGSVDLSSRNHKDSISINLSGVQVGIDFTGYTDENTTSYLTFGTTSIIAYHQSGAFQSVSLVATSADDVISLNDLKTDLLLPTVDGGAGFDSLAIHMAPDSEFVVAADGSVTSSFGHYANLEQFDITIHDGDNTVALIAGDDTITVVATSTGTNDLSGGGGADVITGALGADTLRGGDGDDQLSGSDNDDLLNGGLGNDVIDGGTGIDSAGYDGASSGVTVSLLKSGAQDTKGAGVDTLTGIENLYGSEFKDKLTGDAFANTLRGREGDDLLKGGAGDDRLEGGPGADRMNGGRGADTFAFMKLTDISLGTADHITDFRHADGDRIELANIDLSKDPGDQQFTFIGTAVFTGRDDIFELRVQDAGNNNFLVQGDVNHDGAADFTVAVKTDAPLVATDFVL